MAIFKKAETHINNNNYQEAIIVYSEALVLDPKCIIAYKQLGNAYATLRNYSEAA